MACAPAIAHGMCTCYSPWHVLLLVAKAGQSHSMMSIDRWPTLARYSAVYSGPTLPFYIAMLHCCHILGFGGLHLILHCLHIQGQVLGGLQGTCYCPLCVLLLPALLPTLPPATAAASSQVQSASTQQIVLDYLSGWGVNGSLVMLVPSQPLPELPVVLSSSPPYLPQASTSGLSAGAVAGIVVGSVLGAATLVGTGVLLLLLR